jgi:hypothetical protein
MVRTLTVKNFLVVIRILVSVLRSASTLALANFLSLQPDSYWVILKAMFNYQTGGTCTSRDESIGRRLPPLPFTSSWLSAQSYHNNKVINYFHQKLCKSHTRK